MRRLLLTLLTVLIFVWVFVCPVSATIKVCEDNPSFETQVYLVKNGTVYCYRLVNLATSAELYCARNGKVQVVYADRTYRFTTWGGWYCQKKDCLFICGQYTSSFGSPIRSVVFKWDLSTNKVSYILLPNTGDSNELMSVIVFHNMLFVGERVIGGGTVGSSYPNGGGVWCVPLDQWNNASAWKRIWENPYHFGMVRFAIIGDTLYVFGKNRTSFGLWKYDPSNNTFNLVFVRINVVQTLENNDPWAWAGDAFWEPGVNKLIIAYCNGSTGKVDLLMFNGTLSKPIPTNVSYGSFGVKVAYHLMPNGNIAVVLYSLHGYWREKNQGTDVYLFSLKDRKCILLGTTSVKTSYIINPFVYKNSTCLVIGEHNGWTGEKSGSFWVMYDDPTISMGGVFVPLAKPSVSITVGGLSDFIEPRISIASFNYSMSKTGHISLLHFSNYGAAFKLTFPREKPDIYHISVEVCDNAFGLAKSVDYRVFVFSREIYIGKNVIMSNRTVYASTNSPTTIRYWVYNMKNITLDLISYNQNPRYGDTVLKLRVLSGVVIGGAIYLSIPVNTSFVDEYINGSLIFSGIPVRDGVLNVTLTPFTNGVVYTFVASNVSEAHNRQVWDVALFVGVSILIVLVYLRRKSEKAAIKLFESSGKYFRKIR